MWKSSAQGCFFSEGDAADTLTETSYAAKVTVVLHCLSVIHDFMENPLSDPHPFYA